MTKIIAVVCGGYSGESVVSMRSAAMVMNNIDRTKYTPYQVVITLDRWVVLHDGAEIPVDRNGFSFAISGVKINFDGVFMIIHGTPVKTESCRVISNSSEFQPPRAIR
ncbi:MAG: hypothetical protein IPP69_02620 [Flavobacteriales bacterium]|nr:hypothetical protein [Flavobacteriales bacterium]